MAPNSDGLVQELTNDTFDATIQANPTVLVQFYAPWCGHCKKFAPEYQKIAESVGAKAVVGRVDITKEDSLVERFGIEGFPTIFSFRLGGDPEEYLGPRDSGSIVAWLEARTNPVLQLLPSEAALQGALRKRRALAYVVIRGGDGRVRDSFAELAEKNRKLAVYYAFASEQGGGPSNVPGRLQIYRGVSELVELTLPKEIDEQGPDSILRQLQPELVAAFGEIGEENYEPYFEKVMAHGKEGGVLWVCFAADTFREEAVRHDATFREVASAFPKYLVGYVDTKLYHEHAVEDLGCNVFPTLSLQLGDFGSQDADALKLYKLELSPAPPDDEVKDEETDGKSPPANTEAAQAPGTAVNISASEVIEWIRAVQAGKVEPDDGINFDYEEDVEDDESEDAGEAESNAIEGSPAEPEQHGGPSEDGKGIDEDAKEGAGADQGAQPPKEEL